MYFQEQQQLPVLLPIRKKKNQVIINEGTIQKPEAAQQTLNIFPKQNFNPPEKDIKKNQKSQVKINFGPDKIDEFDKKFKNIHELNEKKEEKEKKKVNNREKQVEKSKNLITEMMRKIDAKNITQQLYPVTNQTIAELIRKMDAQIDDLKNDAQRKENSLSSNPNNQHLKKEIQVLKSSIDRCVTIKELYNQKINLRNKISILERNIISLKEENTNLKIKINRGIETISNHMHNLPCQKEKELKEELKKCQVELRSEKEMRIKLEGNISEIVLNFKRLYEEADTARLIITNKLKELQEKEKKLSEQQIEDPQKDAQSSQKKSPQMQAFEQKRLKKSVQIQNLDPSIQYPQTQKKTPQFSQFRYGNATMNSLDQGKSKQTVKQVEKLKVSSFSMEQQIRKMRNNQIALSKTHYK